MRAPSPAGSTRSAPAMSGTRRHDGSGIATSTGSSAWPARLGPGRRGPSDEEDATLSAFDSFCRGAAEGRFPSLGDRDDLWRLLVTMTARKVADQARREGRLKRGGGRVVGAEAGFDDDDALERALGNEPTPEFARKSVNEYRRLFDSLGDDTLRVVALLKLEGYTNEEIAASLDCGLRSVERKLEVIRKRWLEETRL